MVLEILTPDKKIYSGKVKLVKLVAHNLGARKRPLVARKLVVKEGKPAPVNVFRFRRGVRDLDFGSAHGIPH